MCGMLRVPVRAGHMTRFEQFTLRTITFEVRYAAALMLWDRAGVFWMSMQREHPELAPVEAKPDRTIFQLGNRIRISAQLEKAFVLVQEPSRELDEFSRFAASLVEHLDNFLDVRRFQRVGLRPLWFVDAESRTAASQLVTEAGHFNWRINSACGVQSKPILPAISARFEDEDIGVRLQLKAIERTHHGIASFGSDPPTPADEKTWHAVVDVDYYTRRIVGVDQLNVHEWLAESFGAIRRTARDFV